MGLKKIWRTLTKGDPGSTGGMGGSGGGGGHPLPKEEPLECLAKEAKRDEHLKNLGMKRNKSIRKSIAKKLKRREKKEDLDGTNSVSESVKDKENLPNNVRNKQQQPSPANTSTIQVETRTSIGATIEGGRKVEVITVGSDEQQGSLVGSTQPLPSHLQHEQGGRKMDKLRRSIRHSMRKRREGASELSKAQKWQIDEAAVRSGTCQFYVKYLGCCEVFESRGMQVCEAAVATLKEQRRRTIRGTLYVSGDSVRVVDDDTKGLVLDQTIEKVSFCAPDRNFERGFSYICRDGTTRRWMCHAFMAVGDSGERLSHAVGCAFGVCLEHKQKRDKTNVSVNYDAKESSFTRLGSFRVGTMTERLADPQSYKPVPDTGSLGSAEGSQPSQGSQSESPYCSISRPRPPELMYQRQASFRGLGQIQGTTPAFKRGGRASLSLRVTDLERVGGRGSSSLCDSPILEDLELPPSALEPSPSHELNRGLDLLTSDDIQTSGSSTPCPSLQPTRLAEGEEPTHTHPEGPTPWDQVPGLDLQYYQERTRQTQERSDKIFDFDFDLSVNKGVASFVTVEPKEGLTPSKGTSSGYNSPTSTSSGPNMDTDTAVLALQNSLVHNSILEDPFDAEWAEIATRNSSLVDPRIDPSKGDYSSLMDSPKPPLPSSCPPSTNPFLQPDNIVTSGVASVQAFELQL